MFLSFLIVVQNNQTKLMKTLLSIKEQTSDDYEIVLIDDSGFQPKSPLLEFMNECFYNNIGKQIQVITNLRSQGFSYGINTAISIAQGDFFMIVDEGQTIHKTAVAVLKEKVEAYQVEHKKVDMLEFRLHYTNSKEKSEIWNKCNVLLSPKTNKEVLAYVNCSLFTKIFRRNLILQKNITLLNYRRTDTFFIYNALVYTGEYVAIKDVLVDYELGIVNYSVFDLIKQWIYIFNLYRDLNLYREYQEELEYAFIRFCLVTFLEIVSLQNNKRLSIKAIHSAENKLERRYKSFMKNKYLKNVKEPQFKMIVADIKGFIKHWKLENTK
ncbi:glycosyltransferase [Spiroplasma kunkelii CR2-3x]|uniref:Glycosyltransferase n=2 Tax=Spiroplasma kunkelii TaxID=47834 RepID=A0A0K2JFJ0_SPIKU|nr:glycosyltransferase family 2 protein [Spiroplasma kunkelii]AAP58920.1 glycosyltransferase [Spiroplasma kunkelii CR2-3x]ALA97192.1 glycosyltransferase [Spiroplasma kunkelii CR2-3x]